MWLMWMVLLPNESNTCVICLLFLIITQRCRTVSGCNNGPLSLVIKKQSYIIHRCITFSVNHNDVLIKIEFSNFSIKYFSIMFSITKITSSKNLENGILRLIECLK